MPQSQPPQVCVLAYDGLCTFEFGICVEVFGLPRPELERPWYRFRVVAVEPGPLRATGGIRIEADAGLKALGRADIILVPGWRGMDEPVPEPLIAALRRAHKRGARIASICSGVFVLAAAGLLDGKRATTHWRYAEALQRRFPAVTVEPDVLYVDEGGVLTSAGSAAGLDLCLHMVRRDYGAEIANQVAKRLVLPAHREGGQAQFIPRPVSARREASLAPLLDKVRTRLQEDWPVARLAMEAGMSPRTLLRRFRDATGESPGGWLTAERLAHARMLLEITALDMDGVAEACGFGSTESLRHHFRRAMGLSPSVYRGRFRPVAVRA
jgi:AraC family transcriptional activator FtrA